MIFANARIIFPDAIRGHLDVVVHGRKIVDICAPASSLSDETIDLHGNFLAPGFVDVHVHGANGLDAMVATAEAFGALCAYHAGGGPTSMLLSTPPARCE